jgi:hypothetical protein
MDTILECNAPFYGEVVTVYEPVACYRVHDGNDSLQTTVDKARFDKMSRYFVCKLDYLVGRCQIWGVKFDPVAARELFYLVARVQIGCGQVFGRQGHAGRAGLVHLVSRAQSMYARLPLSNRIIRAAWFVSVAISLRVFARRLIVLRLAITERPVWFERILTTVANIASWRGSARIHAADS